MGGIQGPQDLSSKNIEQLEQVGLDAAENNDMSLVDKVMLLFLEAAESSKEDIERKMESITGQQADADNIKSAINSLNEELGKFDPEDPADDRDMKDVTFMLSDGTEANARDYLDGMDFDLSKDATKDEVSGAISTLENGLDSDNGMRETDMMKLQFSVGEYNRTISMASNVMKTLQGMQDSVARNMA